MSDDTGGARYRPEPLDISAVQLSEELKRLVEILAEDVHDAWAATRFANDWTHAPYTDESKKQHRCLVPYAHLDEEDKAIDRNVVVGILSAMLALGYEILPPPGPASSLSAKRCERDQTGET